MSYHERQTKKRKITYYNDDNVNADLDTSKPTARFTPTGGREWTVSVAIPASTITEKFTAEQRIRIPGQIARALAVFSIDEVVVFDDRPSDFRVRNPDHESATHDTDPCHYIAQVLSFLEAPPFMRKTLFPLHPNLKMAGHLPSLDLPSHPNPRDVLPYREGVTVDGMTRSGEGTLVDVGSRDGLVEIDEDIAPRTRLTLHYANGEGSKPECVDPAAPRTEAGYYWGYSTRQCNSLSAVFTESPFEGGYDTSIGTSERGNTVGKSFPQNRTLKFKHLIVVFGGPRGLEDAARNDPELAEIGIQGRRTKELFDHWVNVLPNQGSRTIRTEEALFIALTGLRRLWDAS